MRNISIAFALVLFACLTAAAQTQGTRTSGVKDVDFSNFSYRVLLGGDDERTIKLRNGKFEEGGKYEEGGMLYELFGRPAYGDLSGDGREDAVVEIKVSGAPSYRDFEVQAYAFQDGQAKLLARIDSEAVLKDYRKYYPNGELHYAGINPPKIKDGHVFIEALVDGSFACPEYTAVFDYNLSGGKFVLTGKPTREQFKCNG